LDEWVGHMTEKVIIRPAEQIEIHPRRHTRLGPADYKPFHRLKEFLEHGAAGRQTGRWKEGRWRGV